MAISEKSLDYRLFAQRENYFTHEPKEHENFIYQAVKNGDISAIEENARKYKNHENSSGKGRLSDSRIKNTLYHMIINTAMITRVCTSAGLSHEIAYSISDMYIRRADKCTSEEDIMRLNDEMTIEFATQMKKYKTPDLSSPVKRAINYICDNLHTKITSDKLAKVAGYERSYFSVLFKKETGVTINNFVNKRRLEIAASILADSDYSCAQIADALGFSSQSHFCRLFSEEYDITPAKYRNKF